VEFREAARIVNALPLPHTNSRRGRTLYQHIRNSRPETLLEMGTARGGSAVFIAAALQANGAGHLTSVDSLRWQRRDPSPHDVIEKAGLGDWVTFDASYSTYTWYLKTQIEKHLGRSGNVQPIYDFIFLDGAKNWSTDGLAVVLAERLLRPGGWLLLDDLGWSYANNVKTSQHYGLKIDQLSDQERDEPHLRAIFDLLIRTNPAFDQFRIEDDWWGWARKSRNRYWLHRGGVLCGGAPIRLRRARDQVWQRVPSPAQRKIRTLRRVI